MKSLKNEHSLIIRFERGEELISGMQKLFPEESYKSGSFTVIGATTNIELGFYSLDTKQYHWRSFVGEYEVTGGVGNIAYFEGKPVVHLHTTIADADFTAFGGHVRKFIVGATCEVTLVFHENTLEREFVSEIGLNLWKL